MIPNFKDFIIKQNINRILRDIQILHPLFSISSNITFMKSEK